MLELKEIEKITDVLHLHECLKKESDRGCALMAAAFLDVWLEELLRKLFVPDKGTTDTMVGVNGPLGTYSARIDAAYLLGTYGNLTRQDLHLIRKVRNDFAHDPKELSFRDEPMAGRCRALNLSRHEPKASPRRRFCDAVLALAATIHIATDESERPDSVAERVLTINERKTWRKQKLK
ncbi:MAG: putative mannitol operon repressor [Verrucomicrobiales bacterium]|nr:putative mannitol operon repressor [Verrucomicrobiales bacterium]